MSSGSAIQITKAVYPLYAMICADCGVVGTLWEKPGTGCSYVRHCIDCGGQRVRDERVDCHEELRRLKERQKP